MTNDKKNYTAVIGFHETLPCYIGEHIKEYLLEKYNMELLLISHPLLENTESYKNTSRFEFYKNSKLVIERKAYHWVLPTLLLYFKDMIYTFVWCFKKRGVWDVFFGIDNVNVLTAIFLRKIGKIKKVIYHPLDYEQIRFKNKFLNCLYFFIDKICVMNADETWNISPGMIEAREKRVGLKKDNRQFVFPVCVWTNKVSRKSFSYINKRKIIFRGLLHKDMGVDLMIKAMPKILKDIPDIMFEIYGDGEERNNLEQEAKRLQVMGSVKFYGWVRERKKLENLMSDAALGIATFNTDIAGDKFRNADPGKIKDYMLMGMPVITTKAMYNFKDIEKNKSGIVINYDIDELTNAVITLLSNFNLLKKYRKNALTYIREFDCGKLFAENMKRVF